MVETLEPPQPLEPPDELKDKWFNMGSITQSEGLVEESEQLQEPSNSSRTRAHKLKPWQERFVAALRLRPIITEACEAAHISVTTARDWRERDLVFREAWDEALEAGWDRAEGAAYTRGVEGIEQPVISMKTGEIMGYKREYSDRMLELLLKGNRAKTYRETHKLEVEHGLSKGMEDVLRDVRMRRQEAKEAQNVRELPVTEVKTLVINSGAQDGESCGGQSGA